MLEIDKIYEGDCLEVMKQFPDNFIDLTVTSPPYDNLRKYHGYTFDFEPIAKELFRVTKPGGVVVWVVGDATIDGSETGTSFKQALYFKEIGFKLHDTMIYQKKNPMPYQHNRYQPCFEYMFVFSKSEPNTFNPISEGTKNAGVLSRLNQRQRENNLTNGNGKGRPIKDDKPKLNVWSYGVGFGVSAAEDYAFNHPAIFPEQLASDHISSWSNPGDLILDPMCGSGTTCKMAKYHDRHFIGIDVSREYCEIARKRISALPKKLTDFAYKSHDL